MKKNCKECGEPFLGRTDKKFCGDLCRNAYHNKSNGYRNALIRHVNHKLRRNRSILAELFNRDVFEITLEELSFLGFDLRFYTQENKLSDQWFRFCYDFGYHLDEESLYVSIIDKPYKNRREAREISNAAESPVKYLDAGAGKDVAVRTGNVDPTSKQIGNS
ncbi:MAG: hypothetical protein U0Y08_01910 [Bacteroidia bacterium]